MPTEGDQLQTNANETTTCRKTNEPSLVPIIVKQCNYPAFKVHEWCEGCVRAMFIKLDEKQITVLSNSANNYIIVLYLLKILIIALKLKKMRDREHRYISREIC